MRAKPNEVQGFFSRQVAGEHGDACNVWPYARCPKGYGTILYKEKKIYVSRAMCIEVHGDPPTPDHEAAHSCGNGRSGCFNPNHVQWKTSTENHADKLIHGTHNRGERQGAARLTEEDIKAIRSSTSRPIDEAKKYSVTPTHISRIRRREKWAWLE